LPAADVATGAVRSYRTFSPLPTSARCWLSPAASYGGQALAGLPDAARQREVGRCIFCATVLRVAPTGR